MVKRIDGFLKEYGLSVGPQDMDAQLECFVAEMKRGLAGEDSSLQMLPTYIQLDDALDYSKDVIVVDAGGTNLRVALVGFTPEGMAEIKYFEKYPMLGVGDAIGVDEFYDRLAEYLAPVADRSDHIGMCFSYPAEVLPNRDARILYFNKEVKVDGAQGTVIGERLRASLEAKGLPGAKSVVVINDTVASLLGAKADNGTRTAYGSYVGLILGTGLNACYIEQNKNILKSPFLREKDGGTIINIESGGYAGMPQSKIDAAFIAATKEPHRQHMEKMSSGAYQGGLLLEYLRAAQGEGLFSAEFGHRLAGVTELSGLDIDRFCDFPFGDTLLASLCAEEADAITVYQISAAFFDRVAMIAATNLSAVLHCLGERAANPCRPVCISAEGTTFYKARLLRPRVDYFMSAYAERQKGLYYRFVKVENATISGSAVAGLLGNGR